MELTEFQNLQKKHDELSTKLSNSELGTNERQVLQREYSFVSDILGKQKEINELEQSFTQSKEQLEKAEDLEMKELFVQEVNELEQKLKKQKSELEDLLYPADELDKCSAFIEIRAGAGGQEAALFVADLLRMYSNYALSKGWSTSLIDFNQTDLKGYKEVVLHIKGKNVYSYLKFESGVHRVQRVPLTETSGRVHTSTVTVAVFPEIEEDAAFEIITTDLRIDVYRAGGAGGQHVNKTESAVRITHIPTGVVVTCQDDRSQHKNKEKALKVLKSRLVVIAREKQDLEMQQKRKEQIGRGMRSEKTRTYNFPQNRVTDHNVELTLSKLDFVMEGDLEEIVQALREKERADIRSAPIIK